jgi:5-methylthioadenosine/S-adenosylhomocysteine deaminase
MQLDVDLLVTGGMVVTQNPARQIIAGGAVAIDGSRIVAVGPAMELDTRFESRRRIDSTGRYVFPGLINTHTHLFQTFMKGLGEGLPLYQWIDEITAPSTVAMPPAKTICRPCWVASRRCAAATTPVLNFMYSMPRTDLYRSVAEALGDLGLREVLARGFMHYGEHHGMPLCQLYPVYRALAEWDDLQRELAAPLLSFALAPEIPFAVSRDGLLTLRRYADRHGMLITMHVNENHEDDRATLADYGRRTICPTGRHQTCVTQQL